jgi:hypothetical protein
MKTIQFLRNPAGIGLVEVMMAVAVTGGLTLTIAKLMENASQSAKQVEAKSENTNLKGLVQDVLNNTTACKNTFGPVMTAANITTLSSSTTATITLPNIKDKLNVIKYSTASTNISPLTITSMELTNYNALAFTGDIIINSNFKKSTNNIVMVKPIRIPINFSFTSGSLTACSTMAVGGEWLLGGNAGTVDGADYLGTSDDAPLNFRVNAQKAGRIDNAGQTFFGYQAGSSLPYGTSGTAFGFRALLSDSGSGNNSAFGSNALTTNSSGLVNTAIGNSSLQNNTIGNANTAVGHGSMMSNVNGLGNTALGLGSMAYGTSGTYNTAVGMNAVYSTSGSNNTGVGFRAIYRTSGSDNTALGYQAGGFSSNGSYNTFVGSNSGSFSSTGSYNLFLGYNANSIAGNTSNKLVIETTGNTTPLIGGDFSTRQVHLNGNVGIGTTTPGTPSTVAMATSAITKLHVKGGITILDQEPWIHFPYSGNYTCSAVSSPYCGYFRDSSGIVHFRGQLAWSSLPVCLAPGYTLFTLPVGYRPVGAPKRFIAPTTMFYAVGGHTTFHTYVISVNPNGAVRIEQPTCDVWMFSLDGVTFPTH